MIYPIFFWEEENLAGRMGFSLSKYGLDGYMFVVNGFKADNRVCFAVSDKSCTVRAVSSRGGWIVKR